MSITPKLRELIEQSGPMPIDKFMELVIPYYYSNQTPFGKAGDFVTAPAISQMFGEIIGIWCANYWLNNGKNKFTLVEIGGGDGTLMADLIRSTKNVEGFHQAIEKIVMVETSPALVEKQRLKINFSRVDWCTHLENVESNDCIVVCNEFFDALPIKQFVFTNEGIKELAVGVENEEFCYVHLPTSETFIDEYKVGRVIEKSSQSLRYAEVINKKIGSNGAALIIDYGYLLPTYKSTLQAVKAHKFHPVLQDIGEADLTAHVDFGCLKNIFTERHVEVMPQGDFLIRYGIMARAASLIASGADSREIHQALARLVNNDQMGQLFKVLEIKAN